MRVVNVAVSNKEYFLEILVRDLISRGVSYVQIENEFHFLDHIYRFYDVKQDWNQIVHFLENQKLADSLSSVFGLFPLDNQDKNMGIMVVEEKNQVMDDYGEQSSNNFFKTNMKRKIRHQNRVINQRLRQNKR